MRQTRLVNKDLHPCVESALLCRAIYSVIHSTTQILLLARSREDYISQLLEPIIKKPSPFM